ncbi:GGDEF domain-containing protein [Actinoplanes sp. NPDC051851]|uniref:GGDEF domain-containing protein n=1 Tax=Actinoplanes sp. NPDC051851 TaxID=3154753 RepID=UPI003437B1AE
MRLRTALATGLFLAAAVQAVHPLLPAWAGYALSDLIIAAASGYAGWHYLRRARRAMESRPVRVGYGFGAAACLTWSLSNLVLLLSATALPVLQGPGSLLSMIAAALVPIAVVLAGPRLHGIAAVRRILDVAAVSGAVFALAWEYVLSEVVAALGGVPQGFAITIVAVLVLGSSVALVTLAESVPKDGVTAQQVLAWAALLQAGTVMLSLRNGVVGDAWYAFGAGGGYVLGAWATAISSRLRISEPGDEAVERLVFGPWALLPYVPVVLAVGVTGMREARVGDLGPVLVWLLLASFSLVLLRQFLTLITVGRMAVVLEQQKRALAHQAHHDGLTGLPNRVAFHQRAAEILAEEHTDVCAMMLDLDGFKPVNDTLGHAAGDEVLVMVAQRLSAELRGADVLSRFGGDEFAILVTDTGGAAEAMAKRLLCRLAEPMLVHGVEVVIGGSIGIAALRNGERISLSLLLRRADTAMYAAKASGKGTVRGYQTDTWPASA